MNAEPDEPVAEEKTEEDDAPITAEALFGTDEEEAPAQSEVLGLTLSEITPELSDQYSLNTEAGLVITAINPDSEASSKGLLEGDVITEAGQQAVATVADLEERIEAATEAGRKSILLLVRRGGDPRFVALSLQE